MVGASKFLKKRAAFNAVMDGACVDVLGHRQVETNGMFPT
jgi:hypothetical protein